MKKIILVLFLSTLAFFAHAIPTSTSVTFGNVINLEKTALSGTDITQFLDLMPEFLHALLISLAKDLTPASESLLSNTHSDMLLYTLQLSRSTGLCFYFP